MDGIRSDGKRVRPLVAHWGAIKQTDGEFVFLPTEINDVWVFRRQLRGAIGVIHPSMALALAVVVVGGVSRVRAAAEITPTLELPTNIR